MSELSFLLDLFLDPDCPCSMRDRLVTRIREVEASYAGLSRPTMVQLSHNTPPHGVETTGFITPVPFERIGQTQEAVRAIADRQKLIDSGLKGTPLTNADGSKRKF